MSIQLGPPKWSDLGFWEQASLILFVAGPILLLIASLVSLFG